MTLERRAEKGGSRGGNLPPLLATHLERSENMQPLQSTLTSRYGGNQPSTNLGGNLPPNGTYLSHNAPPFILNSLQPPPNGHMPIYANPCSQPNASMTYNQPLIYPFHAQGRNPSFGGIEDYTLPDGLEMPSHVGSYDGKGDPDNYLHLFEGVIPSARIWWNGQQACSIVNCEDLKAKFWSYFSQLKKFTKTHLAILGLHEEQHISGFVHRLKTRSLVEFLSTDLRTTCKGPMEKTYTWIKAKEVATNGAPNDHKEGVQQVQLLGNLTKSPRKILATDNAAKAFEQPPCMVGNKRSRDMSKYCHFHEDHGHKTNQCRELRHQIEEVVKSRQLAHIVKGIKKGKAKASDKQKGKWKKGDKDIDPVEAPILMVNREGHTSKRKFIEEAINEIGEISFPSF
ncbi:hypothetical protein Tco_0038702 [Tanacetum coccineum]